MDSFDPETSPSNRSVPEPTTIIPDPAPNHRGPFPDQQGWVWVVAIAAGLAGVVSVIAGEAILNAYQGELTPKLKLRLDPGDLRRMSTAQIHSATATFATMGGILGLAMGLAGGLARRSASAGGKAAILGLLLGAVAPALIALVVLPIFFARHDPNSVDLVLPILTHGAIWSAVGAVSGLAFGVGIGGRGYWKRTLACGMAGAAAATIVYEIVGAMVFPTSKTDLPLSTSIASRAMAQILVAILTAAGAILALRPPPKSTPSPFD